MELESRCSYNFETIESYVLNRLKKRDRNQFQKHVTLCPRCRLATEEEQLFVAMCRLLTGKLGAGPDIEHGLSGICDLFGQPQTAIRRSCAGNRVLE